MDLNKETMVLHLSSFPPVTWKRAFFGVLNFKRWKWSESTACIGLSGINCDDVFFMKYFASWWLALTGIA